MYFAYILRSETSGKTYVGQTADLERRVSEHNDPDHSAVKYTTKNKGPWKLIHSEEFSTRSEAMRREKWLKSGVGREWIKTERL
jgi:putative endonuclease